jgi:hypothetical protein
VGDLKVKEIKAIPVHLPPRMGWRSRRMGAGEGGVRGRQCLWMEPVAMRMQPSAPLEVGWSPDATQRGWWSPSTTGVVQFFLPTVDFLLVPGGNDIYRGIPRYTAKYRSNSNFKPKPILTASSNGFERYTAI